MVYTDSIEDPFSYIIGSPKLWKKIIKSLEIVYPYPATIFCPENVVCFLHLLHVFKYTSD